MSLPLIIHSPQKPSAVTLNGIPVKDVLSDGHLHTYTDIPGGQSLVLTYADVSVSYIALYVSGDTDIFINEGLLSPFTAVTARPAPGYDVKITAFSGVLKTLRVSPVSGKVRLRSVFAASGLELPEGVKKGFVRPSHEARYKFTDSRNNAGLIIARSAEPAAVKTDFSLEYVSEAWTDANAETLSALAGTQVFFCWAGAGQFICDHMTGYPEHPKITNKSPGWYSLDFTINGAL